MRAWSELACARATVGLLVAACATGCATELPAPTTPDEALARGELYRALELARYGAPELQLRVARALIETADPVIEVAPLPDEELVARAGAHAARALRRLAVVVRVTTTTKRPEGDAWRTLGPLQPSTDVALDGLSGSLLEHRADGYSLAAFTGEPYPLSHSETTWRSAQPLWKVDSPISIGFVAAAVLFPIYGLSLLPTSSTTTILPSREEILASAPHADALERALASKCEGGTCTSYHVLRKPMDPGLTLDLALSFSLSSGPLVVHARAATRLPSGDSLEERLLTAGTKRRLVDTPGLTLDTRGGGASRSTCYPTMHVSDAPSELGCGVLHLGRTGAPLPALGLSVPPPPERRGTMASSRAARPRWATTDDERWAPREVRDALPDRPGTWLQCELFPPFDDKRDVVATRFGLAVGDGKKWIEASDRAFISHDARRRDLAVFPLLDVPPGGALTLVGAAANGKAVERTRLTREASGLVVAKNTAHATCTLADPTGVEHAFADVWVEATDALDALAEAPVAVLPEQPDLGRGARTTPLYPLVSRCAALVGWEDPRVRALVERVATEEARFVEAQRKALEALAKEPDATSNSRDVEVGAAAIRCKAGGGCSLVVAVTAVADRVVYPSLSYTLALEDGSIVEGRLSGASLQPRASGEVESVLAAEVAQKAPVAVVLRGLDFRGVRALQRTSTP